MDPTLGSELFGFRLDALLGRGGMGVVYRAYDPRLKRNVALKLIAPELSGDAGFRERFLAETELAASLEHPNVVPIHDAGEVDGQLYLAMRYVDGGELKTLLEREGVLGPRRALAICGQVAAALDAAHARGLVHRDVKPSNVLLDGNEHAYLADFGLSRRLAEVGERGERGVSVGTPAYAAPEQIEDGEADGRADVYSLGCLLYECLTGEVPYPRDSELAVLWAHVQEPPPRPSELDPALPEEIDAVLARALAKSPLERYATCTDLVQATREALGLEKAQSGRISRRTIAIAAAAVVVALAALAAGLTFVLGGENARPRTQLVARNNTVVRIDPKTNKITAVTRVGRDPGSIAYGGTTLWVYNVADHTVEGIDARTNRVVAPPTAISGAAPVPALTHPIAADQDDAWVLSVEPSGRGLLTHVRLDSPSTVEFPLPGSPVSIAHGDGSIWVTTTSAATGALLRIDPRTGAPSGKLVLPRFDGTPNWIAVGGGAVWLMDSGDTDARLYRVDPETMRLTGRRAVDCSVFCETTVGLGSVWVTLLTNVGRGGLLRIDPATLRVTGVIPARRSDLGPDFAFVGNSIWWNGGETVRVDPRTSKVLATVRLTRHPGLWAGPSAIVAAEGSVWVSIFSATGF